MARLAAAGLDVKPARLIDLTLTGTRYESMKAALDIVASAPEFDLVLAVVGSSARFHPELAVKPIIDSRGSAKPIAAYLVPDAPAALAALAQAGVPGFRTPEACADAIAAALGRGEPRIVMASTSITHNRGDTEWLDELAAFKLIDKLGISRAPGVTMNASAPSESMPFAYPVAVKGVVTGVAHKSELGGVVLGVNNHAELLAAIRQIDGNLRHHRPGATLERVLVQPMIKGAGEALIGYRIDPDVGPLVLVAAGGVLTEIYRDRSLRLAPVDLATAHEMITEVRGLAPLAGYRGLPKGDLDALAEAIVALSRLAVMEGSQVLEAEINPLIVKAPGDGAVAVDALIKVMV